MSARRAAPIEISGRLSANRSRDRASGSAARRRVAARETHRCPARLPHRRDRQPAAPDSRAAPLEQRVMAAGDDRRRRGRVDRASPLPASHVRRPAGARKRQLAGRADMRESPAPAREVVDPALFQPQVRSGHSRVSIISAAGGSAALVRACAISACGRILARALLPATVYFPTRIDSRDRRRATAMSAMAIKRGGVRATIVQAAPMRSASPRSVVFNSEYCPIPARATSSQPGSAALHEELDHRHQRHDGNSNSRHVRLRSSRRARLPT